MTDLRAAIRARCAELKKLAEAAGDETDTWYQPRQFDGDPRNGVTRPSHVVRHASEDVVALAYSAELAALIATFGPAAVLELVAGAEEMCEIHTFEWEKPSQFRLEAAECRACVGPTFDETRRVRRLTLWPCPSLRATAKMLGVKVIR